MKQVTLCADCGIDYDPILWYQGEDDHYCKTCRSGRQKTRQNRYRRAAIELLGGECACCGIDNLTFLTIDHVDGYKDGPRSGHELVRYVLDEPEEEFQVLCRNCNWGKYAKGVCPHQAL